MIIERLLMIIGVVLLVLVLAAYVHRAVMVRSSIRSFEQARQQQIESSADIAGNLSHESAESKPADSTSAAVSVAGARPHGSIPLAILRIPRIHLEAPVLRGTDEITLNRGAGQIAGTAVPGEKGNIGIAGHRDSFFRNLKDISRGDVIELETTSASTTYVVERILITGPDDTSVLQPSGKQTLTLVTCYPFHFIGPAPRRFVVQASLK